MGDVLAFIAAGIIVAALALVGLMFAAERGIYALDEWRSGNRAGIIGGVIIFIFIMALVLTHQR